METYPVWISCHVFKGQVFIAPPWRLKRLKASTLDISIGFFRVPGQIPTDREKEVTLGDAARWQ